MAMDGYYSKLLSAERLRRCYEVASPRVRQYLAAEVDHVAGRIRPGDRVLELGCGYGRIIEQLGCQTATLIVGIDTSFDSVKLASETLREAPQAHVLQMDAAKLAFGPRLFDRVLCLQNGMSAFKVDPGALIEECIRVSRPGGTILLSTYAEGFWENRLEWFKAQSDAGLLGQIDWQQTKRGQIVCTDGFRSTTTTGEDFHALLSPLSIDHRLEEVDGSSLFCEIAV